MTRWLHELGDVTAEKLELGMSGFNAVTGRQAINE